MIDCVLEAIKNGTVVSIRPPRLEFGPWKIDLENAENTENGDVWMMWADARFLLLDRVNEEIRERAYAKLHDPL